LSAALFHRRRGGREWSETPMRHLANDRWRATMVLEEIGRHEFRIAAWRDLFATWRMDTAKKHEAGQRISLELEEGRRIIQQALAAGSGCERDDRAALEALLRETSPRSPEGDALAVLMSDEAAVLMRRMGVRTNL